MVHHNLHSRLRLSSFAIWRMERARLSWDSPFIINLHCHVVYLIYHYPVKLLGSASLCTDFPLACILDVVIGPVPLAITIVYICTYIVPCLSFDSLDITDITGGNSSHLLLPVPTIPPSMASSRGSRHHIALPPLIALLSLGVHLAWVLNSV